MVLRAVGTFASLRIALLAGAAALGPAAACIASAGRRIRPVDVGAESADSMIP